MVHVISHLDTAGVSWASTARTASSQSTWVTRVSRGNARMVARVAMPQIIASARPNGQVTTVRSMQVIGSAILHFVIVITMDCVISLLGIVYVSVGLLGAHVLFR